jgi:hypothetical protein
VAKLTPAQRRWRGRVEGGLRLAAPLLDLLLAAGDRLSRAVDRADELEPGAATPPAVGSGRIASPIGGSPE